MGHVSPEEKLRMINEAYLKYLRAEKVRLLDIYRKCIKIELKLSDYKINIDQYKEQTRQSRLTNFWKHSGHRMSNYQGCLKINEQIQLSAKQELLAMRKERKELSDSVYLLSTKYSELLTEIDRIQRL